MTSPGYQQWTNKDELALLDAWARGGMDAALAACPSRTDRAIYCKLIALNAPGMAEYRAKLVGDRYDGKQRQVVELRRQGLCISDVAAQAGLSIPVVHGLLEGQPRRLRFRGAPAMDRDAVFPNIALNRSER